MKSEKLDGSQVMGSGLSLNYIKMIISKLFQILESQVMTTTSGDNQRS